MAHAMRMMRQGMSGMRVMAAASASHASRPAVARRMFADDATAPAGKLLLNFVVPDKAIKSKAHVDMVVVPATRGEMGILSDHVPTVAQLQPGVVAVHSGSEIEKYFISSGFAFVNPNSTDVCAVSAVSISDIDPEEVKRGLAEAEASMSAASDELARAEAQIGIDVFTAMRDAAAAK
ncbi:ATP synthase subunit delta', mitochondrial [Porphyridium purpureum]|uniref:ATP synthase subunit delta', mitochondrial n=1 Tax=Porphyridium purpureum TaxID=35688 RepID=A0A5J4YVG8_PORPP|nr:ATP synthase subunit delta', mitochondrial [Porphyridium purpureum]|eukprot:POR8536..scf227_4